MNLRLARWYILASKGIWGVPTGSDLRMVGSLTLSRRYDVLGVLRCNRTVSLLVSAISSVLASLRSLLNRGFGYTVVVAFRAGNRTLEMTRLSVLVRYLGTCLELCLMLTVIE